LRSDPSPVCTNCYTTLVPGPSPGPKHLSTSPEEEIMFGRRLKYFSTSKTLFNVAGRRNNVQRRRKVFFDVEEYFKRRPNIISSSPTTFKNIYNVARTLFRPLILSLKMFTSSRNVILRQIVVKYTTFWHILGSKAEP